MEIQSTAAKRLEGKVTVITGGASGIGAATSTLFVQHGAYVVIADIQDELGTSLARQLGSSASYFHCNVASEADVEALIAFAVATFGRLDVMFCNAGISTLETAVSSICDVAMQDLDHTMDVNVKGVVLGIKHAARAMRGITPGSKGCTSGSIICTSSVVSQVAGGRGHPYVISKHAVVGVVRSTASELCNYGIRVNAISPFVLDTPLVSNLFKQLQPHIVLSQALPKYSPMAGAHVTVDDIAHVALFLASDETRLINGQNLVVDGGFSIFKRFNLEN